MDQTISEKLKWQLILFLARRLPDCKTITPVFSASIDRKLTFKERIVTRLHLFTCEACVRYLEQIRLLHDLLHARDFTEMQPPATSSMSTESKDRIKAAIRSAT